MSYFLKKFLRVMAVLGYLVRLERGLGLAFDSHFLHGFFHKNIPYLILYHWTKFQCQTYSFSRYQTKCVIKFLFRQLMTP